MIAVMGFAVHYDTSHLSPGRDAVNKIPPEFYASSLFMFLEAVYNTLVHGDHGFTNMRCEVAMLSSAGTAVVAGIEVVAMVIQLREIHKPAVVQANTETTQKREMTITILLLTGVFFLCNTANIASPWMSGSCGELEKIQRTGYIVGYCLGVILPFINSALSPLIMICRAQKIRAFVITNCFRDEA